MFRSVNNLPAFWCCFCLGCSTSSHLNRVLYRTNGHKTCEFLQSSTVAVWPFCTVCSQSNANTSLLPKIANVVVLKNTKVITVPLRTYLLLLLVRSTASCRRAASVVFGATSYVVASAGVLNGSTLTDGFCRVLIVRSTKSVFGLFVLWGMR